MIKKFIVSYIFLILSLSLFVFFLTNRVEQYVALLVSYNADLPLITKLVLYMSYTVMNWFIIITPLVFLFLLAIIFAALSGKRIELLFKINVAVAIFFLVLSLVSYAGMELPIWKIMKII